MLREKIVNLTEMMCKYHVDNSSYQITINSKNKLGEGVYAKVYRGSYNKLDVAIRVCKTSSRYRLLQESRILVKIAEESLNQQEHAKNIVKFYGFDNADPSRYVFIFEYINQGTLTNWIESLNEFNFPQSYGFMQDVASGLKFLHELNIVHCDIKTDNILIHRLKNGKLQAKISDFNLSVDLTYQKNISGRGTPMYLAPEVLSKTSNCTFQSDIYSFAITFLITVNLSEPYGSLNDVHELKDKVVNQNQRPKIRSECPYKMAGLIKWCWQKDLTDRPSADRLVEELSTPINEISPSLLTWVRS